MTTPRPFLLAGRLTTGNAEWRITNPFNGSEVGVVSVASRAQVEEAVSRAADAAPDG